MQSMTTFMPSHWLKHDAVNLYRLCTRSFSLQILNEKGNLVMSSAEAQKLLFPSVHLHHFSWIIHVYHLQLDYKQCNKWYFCVLCCCLYGNVTTANYLWRQLLSMVLSSYGGGNTSYLLIMHAFTWSAQACCWTQNDKCHNKACTGRHHWLMLHR